ncbi:adenosylmethionine--8-amino-7-oxononanoate transaminase [Thermogutta sp.]|uniref:adenosylmethionine--8-amino-7-oxononanoate transaminase n=1 Tax=Thermogutta sp. TaxID=1962930 RepID=UPI003C7EB8EF
MEEKEKELLREWDRTIYWHAFTQMAEYEPFIIERAQGCRLFDIDGREYIDGVASLWCNVHGHRHPRLDRAIREQLDRVAHVTSLGCSNPTTIRLAKRLTEIAPPGLNHVFFADSGAGAVEVALKVAFQYWRQIPEPQPQKTLFLALGEAYHGDTLGAVSVGGVDRFNAVFQPLMFPTIRLPCPDTYRTPDGVPSEKLTEYYLAQLEDVLRREHQRIVGMIIEPLVQCAAGMVVHPPGYLRGVRELTRKYGVLLIADEVAVGFGRTGRMFACEHEGVTPDLLCLGKGITGGYLPVAATLVTDEIYNAFLGDYASLRTFFHGHTYGGNPLGAAVALANLDVFEEERTLEQLPPKIERLASHLRRIAERSHVGHVRQRGLIAGIELVQDKATKRAYPWTERRGWQVCQYARQEGVFLRPLGDVIVIFPPLAISPEEIDLICQAVERGIIAVTE